VFGVKDLQAEVGKILKEKGVKLSQEALLLGIYEELSNLTRASLARGGLPSSNPERNINESIGELGAMVLEMCNQSGVSFEEVVQDYVETLRS
jgi:hypothetical protein